MKEEQTACPHMQKEEAIVGGHSPEMAANPPCLGH